MEKQDYASITITDIANKAGLSRRTFYRHFKTVDELLLHILRKNIIESYNYIRHQNPQKFSDFVFVFFSYWEINQNLLKLIVKNNLTHFFISELYKNVDKSMLAYYILNENDYLYSFAVGGISNLLIQWINDGFTKSPKKMKSIAEEISQHLSKMI